MIKTTFKTVDASKQSLQALFSTKLPVKAAYAVGKLAQACDGAMAEYAEKRGKIFETAGCVAKDGKWVHIEQGVIDACVKEADELSEAEVELNALPLDIEQFGSVEVPGYVFVHLDWAVKQ